MSVNFVSKLRSSITFWGLMKCDSTPVKTDFGVAKGTLYELVFLQMWNYHPTSETASQFQQAALIRLSH